MCGLAGIVQPDGSLDPALLAAMARCLAHRGPDDRGYLTWSPGEVARIDAEIGALPRGSVGFAHNRLTILDLSAAGRQPMSSEDGRHHLVYNGEIYNYVELRGELERLGHGFRSTGDTEVLLAALIEWGRGALNRLEGMFALAFLDTARRRLLLARDPFGIKPLYYAGTAGGLAFASEIKALLELPSVHARADPARLFDYLRFGITDHGDRTMFASIRQLPAAHWIEIDVTEGVPSEPQPYWRLDPDPRDDLSFEEAADHLRQLFLGNVRRHLRSDVALGSALSGGIDSSAVIASVRHLLGPDAELHAFSYVADGPLGEEQWIDLIGDHVSARVHKTRPAADELIDDLDELIAIQDEPFMSTSIYAQLRVFRLVRQTGVKVVLDGQGADELMAGYRPHVASRLLSLLRRGRLIAAAAFLRHCSRYEGVRALRVAMHAGALALPTAVNRRARRLLREDLFPPWLDRAWFAAAGVEGEPAWRSRDRDALRETLVRSVTEKGLPMLLRYEDRNSMACSVESRVPFLTCDLARFVLSLPESYLLAPTGESKAVFRRAMRGLVPDAILDRRDKIGFAVPEQDWFATLPGWVGGVLDDPLTGDAGPLNAPALRRHWHRVRDGERPWDPAIWRALNFLRWMRGRSVCLEP